jgi:hypothetical protein
MEDDEDASGAIVPGSKRWWGPLLWSLFHSLAEHSDRKDVIQLWLNLFKLTADVLPCPNCRRHLHDYLKAHVFLKPMNVAKTKGIRFKEVIRRDIWALHTDVNLRLGKPNVPLEDLATKYNQTREDALASAHIIAEQLKTAWSPFLMKQILPGIYNRWFATLRMLMAVLAMGPTP